MRMSKLHGGHSLNYKINEKSGKSMNCLQHGHLQPTTMNCSGKSDISITRPPHLGHSIQYANEEFSVAYASSGGGLYVLDGFFLTTERDTLNDLPLQLRTNENNHKCISINVRDVRTRR